MKKPTLNVNFGEGGFQGWVVRHCEKLILGVIVLLAGWVIWSGYGLPGLESGKSPDKLRETANSQRSTIVNTRWETFLAGNPDRLQRTVVGNAAAEMPIDPLAYPRPNLWNPPDFPRLTPRTDPEIYPPINLQVAAFVGPVAYQPLSGMKDGLTGEAGRGGVAAPPRVGVAGPAGPAAGALPGEDIPGGGDLLSEFAAADSGAAPGEDPMTMGRGISGYGAPAPESSYYQAPPNSIAKSRYGVVLMALVQHEKQWEEYNRKLYDSLDHDAMRDQPNYLTFFVQRVDVTDDPSVDPAAIPEDAWEGVSNKAILDDAMKWAGYPREVLDPNYLLPVDPASNRIGLTQPIPPFVQRDLWEAMTHPDIPLASAARQSPTELVPDESTSEEEGAIPGIPGIPGVGGAGRGGTRPGGFPGAGGAIPGAGAFPGAGLMPGIGNMAMPGADAGAMPGANVLGYGSSQTTYGPQVKYKLIRVTDFTVEPGRKYRYRLQVVLDDPNNPKLAFKTPRPASLDASVQTRISAEGDKKPYVHSKEWSEPSEVVSLPAEHWFFAGKVEAQRSDTFVENTRPVRREPKATILAIVHDPAKGADVPVEQEVDRGSTINLKTEVNVIHPIKGNVHNITDYVIRTDAVVADIIGGEVIPNIHKERSGDKMTVPGEILLIDSDGNLLVQDEAEDVEDFRRYVRPAEEMKPAASDDPALMDPMSDTALPGEDPGGDMGPRRRRRGMP